MSKHLKSNFIDFMRFFFKELTNRDFIISSPISRQSHHTIMAEALTRAFRLELPTQRLIINVSPGSGKSTMCSFWVAWCIANFPDSRFMYLSYSSTIATKSTELIKRIITLPAFGHLFRVYVRRDSKAKDAFQTTHGGMIRAAGSSGSITGFDAGLPGLERFSGAVLYDDAHKTDEVHSDTLRAKVIENYRETILQRMRGVNVPIIFTGQRLHEDDLPAYLLAGKDGYEWDKVILKSIDDAGNALYPEVDPLEKLLIKKEVDPYVFASQYQQNPIPSGGGIFKSEWFAILEIEPKVISTFITADTAETSKKYNDATVFSFFGLYEIESMGVKTGQMGLHWIDTIEVRVEPKDLKNTFLDFWQQCLTYTVKPSLLAIEKKSTGGTLLSLLSEIQTLRLMDIPRNRETGNKTKRFLEAQPVVAERRVSFTRDARHMKLCIEHMSKITANETHRWDDIADTLADAIKLALIDKVLIIPELTDNRYTELASVFSSKNAYADSIRRKVYNTRR